MNDEGGGEEQHKKSGVSKIYLAILAVLCLLIIVLIVLIGVFNGNRTEDTVDIDEFEEHEKAKQEYVQRLADGDRSYQISLEISNVYNDEGRKEDALKMYEDELNKALEAKDYALFSELVSTRFTMLELDGRCSDAVLLYDTIDYDRLPSDYQQSIYENAYYDSGDCSDVEHEQYWKGKLNE